MRLITGTRLGTYEITSALGAGGMGEVYRARDTRLQRDVALKVLPEAFAADPERLARFAREAQVLASLNHPHIAHIYGIEESGGTSALVMELVEGEELTERIRRGPLALDEALPIARQIAEALETAHERGVIHRDLKPANVRLTPTGSVKVLDFGLAKAVDASVAGENDLRNSPTFTSPQMTGLGVILGTAAYMAPEQAKGKTVDKRADIWAFGVLLFEMLTGRTLFAAETASETVAAVLRAEVDLRQLPAGTPAELRQLIARCLERDPQLRLRDIGEARIMLASPVVPEAADARALSRWRAPLVWTVLGLLAGAAMMWLLSRSGPDASVAAAPQFSLRRITEMPGPELQPDISPDGRQIVFASAASGNLDIYLLRVGGGRAINLTANNTSGDQQAAFSPDGEQIAFRSERNGGGIFVMGATGESVRRVTTAGYDPAWSPDGRALAYTTEPVVDPHARNIQSELWLADVATGKTTRLLEGDAVQAAWSPDGKRLAYWANSGGQRDIWTVAAEGGAPVALTADGATDWSPEWAPDGRSLYFASDRGGTMNIWRVAIQPSSGRALGAPEAITSSLTGVGYARITADGQRLAIMGYHRSFELSTAPLVTSGADVSLGPVTSVRSESLGWCAISPDGTWLACTSRGAQEDIVLMRTDGSETVRLMDDAAKDRNATWSPDGETVAFMSTRSGVWELWSVRRDGSDLRQMTDLKANVYEAVWAHDGRRALSSITVARPFGVWVFDTAAAATPSNARFFENPLPEAFGAEAWSPDGSLVAGSILNASGNPRMPAVWDFPDGKIRTIDLPAPAQARDYLVAGWLGGSRRFVAATGSGLAVIDALTGAARPIAGAPTAGRYRLSADGRQLFFERVVLDSDVWLMELTQ
jgi:Tol biopolymer transport system component